MGDACAKPLRCDARTSAPDRGFRDAPEKEWAVLTAGEGSHLVLGHESHAEDGDGGHWD